jgi:hypothetical protein
MDDYSGLAARVAAGVGGLRGCLILSRDGLVLGAHPDDDEHVVKPSWLRFASLGEPERSFVEFGDQVWVYVHRGPYSAFAVADAGVRPGLVIDQLEQALLMAEESRTKRDGLRAPEGAPAAAGPRTVLHPPASPATPEPAVVVPVASAPEAPSAPPARSAPPETPPTTQLETPSDAPPAAERKPPAPPEAPTPEAEAEPPRHEAPKLMTTPVTPKRDPGEGDDAEVDRVLLAQEFSGLLQDLDSDDDTRA